MTLFEQFENQLNDFYSKGRLEYLEKEALIEKAKLIEKELDKQVFEKRISVEQYGILYSKVLQSLLHEAERIARARKWRPYKILTLCLIIITLATLGVVLPEFRLPMSRYEVLFLVITWLWIGWEFLNYGASPINPYVPDYAITIGEKAYRERSMGIFALIWFILLILIIIFIRGIYLGWNRHWWFILTGWVLLLFGSLIAILIKAEQRF